MNTLRFGICLAATALAHPAVAQTTPPAPQRVDVLVVYTPAARAYAGSTAAMKAAINTYVAATNTAFTNSDVNVVLRLAGAEEVAYTETSSLTTDLGYLFSVSDAYLTTVQSLREAYKADLVSLVRRDGASGSAGTAYLGNLSASFASYAYSVVADTWAVSNLSFPHEISHNFGCQHDHATASNAARIYAYGHRFTGSNGAPFRTVMSTQSGSRVAHFSNPEINYQGRPTGIAGTGATAADNARMLEESSVVTRTFRNASGRLGGLKIGNLDNTGTPDLVLSDSATGERYVWFMSGITRLSSASLPQAGVEWRLAAAGDFNTDQKTDLVFENTSTGARSIWLMNGATRISTVSLTTAPVAWRIATAGDFNADGRSDLVWENTSTGQRAIGLMNGTSQGATTIFSTDDIAWRIAAAADLNADGRLDLVVEHTTGQHAVWYMNSTTRTGIAALPTSTANLRVAGAGDFNADGRPDLVLEDVNTKARLVWYLNGIVQTGIAALPQPDFN